jgi:DNA repair protein RecO (recombination protein O)
VPAHGGVVCSACAERSPTGLRLGAPLRDALLELQRGAEPSEVEPALARAARDLLDEFIAHHLRKRLRTRDFLALAADPAPGAGLPT